jgi:membrane protein
VHDLLEDRLLDRRRGGGERGRFVDLPDGAEPGRSQWRWLTPGSVLATGTWLIATYAFGIYVQNFGNYQAVYGALGAIIVFLIWLYLSAYILLLGAELNQVLAEKGETTQ